MIDNVEKAIFAAENDITKLGNNIFEIPGFSSRKFRIFLNKLVSFPNTKYLEVGCWQGSTLCSALHKNNPEYAFAIDNFSQRWDENNPKEKFLANTNAFINCSYNFVDADCFSFDLDFIKQKINTYFYDGDHKEEDQYKALKYYYPVLEDNFIYICDDFNWMDVRIGTFKAISDLNLKIQREWILPAYFNGDTANWWNGCYVAVLAK